MREFLMKLGLTEGIAETILWWSPYLGIFVTIIALVIIVNIVRKRKK